MTSGLRGRDSEVRAVLALLGHARAGQSGALVIRGEAGTGKTALLDVAAGAARGMTLLRATAIETEAELPFAGLHLLLRPTLGRLDRVPRPQALALERAFGQAEAAGAAQQPADDVFLAGLAVLSLLAETVEDPEGDRPLLCLVDDAQWLDSASATALLFAARRLGSDGVAMVLAVRDGSLPLDTRGMDQFHLDPLDGAAAHALLNDAAPGLDPHVCARVLDDAAGNPLAITELARAAAATPSRGQYGRPGPLAAGQRMQRLYGRQVSDLPGATRVLLLVAAAAGAGEVAPVLQAARSLGVEADALTPAEQAGLVTVAEQTIVFRHPLVRAAVYHDAPLASRQAAHRALAGALADGGTADGETADTGTTAVGRRTWHLASAAAGRDDHAASELEAAAERASHVGGYAAVEAAYERAAELTTDPAVRARRLLAAATAASDIGRSQEATGCCGWPRKPRLTRCCWPRPPIYGRAATRPATAIAWSRWPTPPGASPTTIRSWPCGCSEAWWSRPATTARAGSRSGPPPRSRASRGPPRPGLPPPRRPTPRRPAPRRPIPGRPPRMSG